MKSAGKIRKLLLVFLLLFLLVGCGYTEEEKALMQTYKQNGEINAVDYIKEKYGIDARVLDSRALTVDPGPVPDFSPSPSGMVDVHMEYENRNFQVRISGEELNTDGKDDYQKEEIETAFKKSLMQDLKIEISEISVQYADDCLVDLTFYDVDSFLEELKNHYLVSIVVKTLDDLPDKTISNIHSDNLELLVVACQDEDALSSLDHFDYLTKQGYKQNFYNVDALNNKMREYSLFMKGHIFRDMNGEVDIKRYARQETAEGFYLVYEEKPHSEDVSLNVTDEMKSIKEWNQNAGLVEGYPAFSNPKYIGKSYEVEFGDAATIQVYINKNAIEETQKEEKFVALQYLDDHKDQTYDYIPALLVENYYSFTLQRQENLCFTLVMNRK